MKSRGHDTIPPPLTEDETPVGAYRSDYRGLASATNELTTITGVTGVEIDPATGAVSVESEAPLAPDAVAVVVDEAKYALG